MTKATKILIVIAAIIIIAFLFSLALLKFNIINNSWFQPKYAMIYLNSGDVYFGRVAKLTTFELNNAVFLQKDANGKLSVQKFRDSAWQPEDTIHFEKQQIAFWSYLKPESPIIQFINEEISTNNAQNQQETNKIASSTTPGD